MNQELLDVRKDRIALFPHSLKHLSGRVLNRVAVASDRDLLQLHDIARQRARFVAEHILHLAELFVQVGGARHRAKVALLVMHFVVLLLTSVQTS